MEFEEYWTADQGDSQELIYHDPEAVPVYRSVSGISEQSGAEPGKPDAEQSADYG